MNEKELIMKQIAVTPGGMGPLHLYGVSEDGAVYRFDRGCQGWVALPMFVMSMPEV